MDSIKQLKQILLVAILALGACASANGQATKPKLMVVPSDLFCESRGYTSAFIDETGAEVIVPNYEEAVKDADFRNVVMKLSEMMLEREFPLTSLEATLKNIRQEAIETSFLTSESGGMVYESPLDILTRTAKADILLEVNFSIESSGPRKRIRYDLQGLDSYTQKTIAAISETGPSSASAPIGTLLEAAVIDDLDKFNGQLQNYFTALFEKGREIKIVVKVWDSALVKLNADVSFNGYMVRLDQVIQRGWVAKNCLGGSYNTTHNTSTELRLEQVHIPMLKEDPIFGGMQTVDAMSFVQELGAWLQTNYQIPFGVYARGLGEAHIILGEKEN